MKKLLYTLLLGLVVISCEKDMDGDTYSIAAPSQEIKATTDINSINLNESIDRLLSKLPSSKGESSSLTAKIPVAGSSYILFLLKSEATAEYEIFIGDDVSEFCDEATDLSDFLVIYLTFESTSLTNVRLSLDGEVLNSIDRDLTTAFSLDGLFLGDKIDFTARTITSAEGASGSITF